MGGPRLKPGECFLATTKKMTKDRHMDSKMNKELNGPLITYEVLRPGDKRWFQKGKRKYYCEVVALQEIRTGKHTTAFTIYYGEHYPKDCPLNISRVNAGWGRRYWQFTYVVKVIEN